MLDLFEIGPKDRLIAQLLLSHGAISGADLRKALNRRKESSFFSLAEVLIGEGFVSLAVLDEFLRDYFRKLRLGELALAQGFIDEHQLEVALAVQSTREQKLGEIFVELHFATPHQIETLLDFQHRCRGLATT